MAKKTYNGHLFNSEKEEGDFILVQAKDFLDTIVVAIQEEKLTRFDQNYYKDCLTYRFVFRFVAGTDHYQFTIHHLERKSCLLTIHYDIRRQEGYISDCLLRHSGSNLFYQDDKVLKEMLEKVKHVYECRTMDIDTLLGEPTLPVKIEKRESLRTVLDLDVQKLLFEMDKRKEHFSEEFSDWTKEWFHNLVKEERILRNDALQQEIKRLFYDEVTPLVRSYLRLSEYSMAQLETLAWETLRELAEFLQEKIEAHSLALFKKTVETLSKRYGDHEEKEETKTKEEIMSDIIEKLSEEEIERETKNE